MNKHCLAFIITLPLLCLLVAPAGAAEKGKIRVAGSGGMIPLVTELAKHFMAERPDVLIEVSQKSIQSSGGIEGAAGGSLEIGMSNRPLKDDEQKLGLVTAEIARVGVVLGANKNLTVRNITSDALCSIYEGKITNWEELGGHKEKIIALSKPEKDSIKETIRKVIPCFKNLREAATVKIIPTSPEMTTALANSRCVGFTDSAFVGASHGAIHAVALDGVEATAENIRSGKYKLLQAFRLVTKGKPDGKVKDFIDYVKGPKGKQVIEKNGAISVK